MNSANLGKYLKILDVQCESVEIEGSALDSRQVRKGMIFFACKGENVDGNRYAQAALDAGAAVVVMDDRTLYDSVQGNKILVEDTVQNILRMAKLRIKDIKATKIAITGSFGKTSTKEMIKLLLESKYKTQATEGNYNNMLGLSLTICGINDSTEMAIFEMGTNAAGEIAQLSTLVKPDIVVLTGYGYAHIGKFQGLAQVVHEKLSIVDHMNKEGRGLVIAHDKFSKGLELKDKSIMKELVLFGLRVKPQWLSELDLAVADEEYKGRQIHFNIWTKETEEGVAYPCMINYPYIHLAENFLAAFAVGRSVGLEYADMIKLIATYETVQSRGTLTELGGLTIIDDTYNASLDAILKAVDNLAHFGNGKKYALIGEVKEIDGYESQIYDAILDKAVEYPDINFIFSGISYAQYDGCGEYTVAMTDEDTFAALDKVDTGVLLVKASHSCHFERYVNYMKKGRS
jgi:UDP-N-acetylmuramoyl-tripeptide--D-alanyl-D-alanine ligase